MRVFAEIGLAIRVTFLAVALAVAGCTTPPVSPPKELLTDRLTAVGNAVESFISKGQMPGAVYRLEREGVSWRHAWGRQTQESNSPAMTVDTVFDVASLTKVVATTPAVMLLIEDGKLDLDTPLARDFPECRQLGKDHILLRHLLTHTSGLPAGIPRTTPWSGAAAALVLACTQATTHAPGNFFRYSDINFILLGLWVERLSGESLATFTQRRVFAPLGMQQTGFLPLAQTPTINIAPTERLLENGVERVLQGEVHDPTARLIGGIAGHAGLFSTAGDMARYARMLLNEGELEGVRILSRNSVRLMTRVHTAPPVEARRGLGWDIDSPYSRPRGTVYPLGSYGHTGFTGCILWIDPASRSFYVFLSNRVYPRGGTNILPLYSQLGTLSAEAVGAAP